MAKVLTFKMAGSEYCAAPVKLERKKVYGWTNLVATDQRGETCSVAYLSPDDALVIPSGGLKQATVDETGKWVEKNSLVAYGEDDTPLPLVPSSFDAPITLSETATEEEFLDNEWESVYQLAAPALAEAVGDLIYKFDFSYRGGTSHNDAYLMNTPSGLFLFTGNRQEFPLLTLAEETTIDDNEEPEEDIDELDFGMF
ncbi:MAG: hypothetical protein IKX33_08615 [Prevotella sp.]|nr:hypothetical protein [Prevotella sp.]